MTETHKPSQKPARRVFSGVQPTGQLHLGNYLGAIRHFVDLQSPMSHNQVPQKPVPQKDECLYCVVDLHAITQKQEPQALCANTRLVAAAFIAAGIDPKSNIIFNQSQVPFHTELAWILSCTARIGWLERMTQFKEKSRKNREAAAVGLYIYPILMAADILLYRATHVPVGEDQKQHLELARDIAQKFNHDTMRGVEAQGGAFFTLPEPLIQATGARVMSLRDGTQKMSKSDPSDMSRINLTDDADMIARKIRKAKTDADLLPDTPAGLEARPEAYNLMGLLAALKQVSLEDVITAYAGQQFSVLKGDLIDVCCAAIVPIGDEMRRLLDDTPYLDTILSDGAARACAIASPLMDELRALVGFLPSK